MPQRTHNPTAIAAPRGSSYSHGIEVQDGKRLLFISGQIPETVEGAVPATFGEQADIVWGNILAVLASAGMGAEDLVKVTMILTSRDFLPVHREKRQQYLGEHKPAFTVIVAETLDPRWLLEVEAIAVANS